MLRSIMSVSIICVMSTSTYKQALRVILTTIFINRLGPKPTQSKFFGPKPCRSMAIFSVAALFLLLFAVNTGAMAQSLKDVFAVNSASSVAKIDHMPWAQLLRKYVTNSADGVMRVKYKAFSAQDRAKLKAYLKDMQAIKIGRYNRSEQFAYWVNLYNAATVEVILAHYPVATIRDIDISPGLFSNGPWGKKLLKVKNIELSLDDIEHEILRKIWRDPRIHYAVNCASIGCPNLMRQPYRAAALEHMLNQAARAYINHPRGVTLTKGGISLSKIFKWYAKDFGSSQAKVLNHIRRYASPALKRKLKAANNIAGYHYDWTLNEAKP